MRGSKLKEGRYWFQGEEELFIIRFIHMPWIGNDNAEDAPHL